ncbi:60s ribosomal protein l24 [Quercus suber]|uniref:60s ribosomal protein l24 n=1 Tax=Quercus suber TaxID=58331 RepID=A0AAW0JKS9_QUESU
MRNLGFRSLLFQCTCSVLSDVSGLNSAASAGRRYTQVGVSDLSDQILRGCWFSCFCTEIDVCLLVWSIQVFLFVNSKCKRYFHNKLKPSKLTWTAMYRKQHKKVEYPSII